MKVSYKLSDLENSSSGEEAFRVSEKAWNGALG
jgi:hypothetical protein